MAILSLDQSTALLVKNTDKITMSQEIIVTTPYAVVWTLKNPPSQWLANAQLAHYQALLRNPPCIKYNPSSALNLATLLPALTSDI